MAAPSKQWASQAKINALLRFSPQREALANLTHEAREQYEGSIKGAKTAGALTSQAVEKAKPEVSGIFDRAQGATSATQSQLASALAALGPAAGGFKAAAATEGAAGQEKAARERAAAESGLEQQDVSAKEAPAFARTLANQQLATSLAKIFSSTQSVAANEGAATASELGKLEDQAEGRRVTERGQNLTSRSAAETRNQKAHEHEEDLAAKAKAENGGQLKLLPQEKQTIAASTLRGIESDARALRNEHGLGAGQVYKELTTEHPAYNAPKLDENGRVIRKAPPKGSPKGTLGEVEYERIDPLKPHDALLAQAAIESVYGSGAVSRKTLERLHAAGYSLKALGLAVRKEEGVGAINQQQSTAPGSRISAERERARAH